MSKIIVLITAFIGFNLASHAVAAQNATEKKVTWQELRDFHEVMSTTFHPAEEKNFAPLKEKSGLLVERAEAWKKSPVPEGFKPEETAKVLKRLVKQCKQVDKMVKKGKTDEELFAGISKAHDIFHELIEKCRD